MTTGSDSRAYPEADVTEVDVTEAERNDLEVRDDPELRDDQPDDQPDDLDDGPDDLQDDLEVREDLTPPDVADLTLVADEPMDEPVVEPVVVGGDDAGEADWLALQGRFVDDPAAAVQDAAGLVEAAIDRLRQSLPAGSGDTEELRQAFQRYRAVHQVVTGA